MQKIKNKIQEVLIENKGTLVSDYCDYKNAQTKLIWMCATGHEFSMAWNKVQQGQWCPYCAGRYISLKDIQTIAVSKGGQCLSTTYSKSIDKLLWKCSLGHQWYASLNSVKNQNSWCPYCNKSVVEEICRKFFEFIFKQKFPRVRPAWLTNTAGHRLELDGFCDNLKIAFEYNGPHHYENVGYIDTDLEIVQVNDKIKLELCQSNNIVLIVIPHVDDGKPPQSYIKDFLMNILPKYGFREPIVFPDFIKDEDLYDYDPLNELQILAIDHGGKCLSDNYQGSHVPLRWQCSRGHSWDATPTTVKNRNSWCPVCADPNKMELEDLIVQLNDMRDTEGDLFKKRILMRAISYMSENINVK